MYAKARVAGHLVARPLLSLKTAVAMLEDHAERIADAVADVPPSRLRSDPLLGEWTATDVLAHLRCCADTCQDVLPRILAADRPRLEVLGPRDRIEMTNYRELAFRVSFRAFTRQRGRLLEMLRALAPSASSRSAFIVERGRRRERTVGDYTDWLARHEARHVEDFERFGRRSVGRRLDTGS